MSEQQSHEGVTVAEIRALYPALAALIEAAPERIDKWHEQLHARQHGERRHSRSRGRVRPPAAR